MARDQYTDLLEQPSAPTKVWKTALYLRLSREDGDKAESNSIGSQVVICKGWIFPSNTYDCGSFVVNRKAVVGKE